MMSIEEKPTKESTAVGGSKTPEFEPPQACVSRIIKNVLPENIQITKDARAAFTRAAGIFIFYLTHCANDFSKEKKRQTIYTEDVLNALKELDFGEFQAPLEEFLKLYKEEADSKKPREKKSDGGGSASAEGAGDDGDGDAEAEADEGMVGDGDEDGEAVDLKEEGDDDAGAADDGDGEGDGDGNYND